MTASATDFGNADSPIKVEIEKAEAGYRLLRGGEPYSVRGAGMVVDDIERFAKAGGNSIRNWSTMQRGQDTTALLDSAHAHGVTVALGLPMVPERHGFDYDDAEAAATQLEMMRGEVLKYRDHPAVLVWVIGNELNHGYDNPRVYDAVNDVAEMIHELDPYHPTTTTTSGFKPDVNAQILARAPALDFISFQMYGSLFRFTDRLAETGFGAPFMVTEWGTIGYWETEKTDWGAPIEVHSSEKADTFLVAYRDILAPLDGQLLGSYAFYWGQKQERTPTWFGMLTEDGDLTEVVHAIFMDRRVAGEPHAACRDPAAGRQECLGERQARGRSDLRGHFSRAGPERRRDLLPLGAQARKYGNIRRRRLRRASISARRLRVGSGCRKNHYAVTGAGQVPAVRVCH